MQNLQWNDGAPEKLEPGMLIRWESGAFDLVGSVDFEMSESGQSSARLEWLMRDCIAWAWVIKPHELEWAADIAGKHAKGRPEQ